jgi:hypothetical protein
MANKGKLVLLVVAVTMLLRLVGFPDRYEVRDVDEIGYLYGGLALLEGIPPGYKAAPGGPLYWIGWAYAGAQSAWHVLHPGPEERAAPVQLRPFVAVNHALFDNYHDISHLHALTVAILIATSLLAAAAAALLGYRLGGSHGAILAAGFYAVCPLMLRFSLMARPYVLGWNFGILGLALAARPRRNILYPAVFLGLAIASRIDMLCLAPMVLWVMWVADCSPSCEAIAAPASASPAPAPPPVTSRRFPTLLVEMFKLLTISAVVAIVMSPWLITNLIGELRAIATIRFSAPPMGPTPWQVSLGDFGLDQGAGIVSALILVALVLLPGPRRWRTAILVLYVALLMAGLLKERGFGIHQHAAIFVGLVLLLAAIGPALVQPPGRALVVRVAIALALLLPLVQSSRLIVQLRHGFVRDGSAEWIEHNVKPGTHVYWGAHTLTARQVLPTQTSADQSWDEVVKPAAWQSKIKSGMARFGLASPDVLPRALSEEIMVQERGNRRGFFILGSRPDYPAPRFDVRLIGGSVVFSDRNVDQTWKSTGGVLVWRTLGEPVALRDMPPPTMAWINNRGTTSTYLYCTPDALIDPAMTAATDVVPSR